ncbi:MAG TPA: ATPase, partial [Deltaproteobacteria bacterium]|nr:ATPase [Deltaproteobacteria bacterium]
MAAGGESIWSFVFKFFNFAVLVGLLIYFVGKPLKSYLAKRHQTVKTQLEETQKALKEAEA